MLYFEEANRIWQECVPKSGQSGTVEGELLRAVEKLRDGAMRNGNINWDEGFEILLSYLNDRLLDPSVFNPGSIARSSEILERLKDYEYPVIDDEVYDHLSDQVVVYFRHFGSLKHIHNPELHR